MVMTDAFAQDITVKGTVNDASTGEVIVGATVQLQGSTSVYTMTDAMGDFSLTVPEDGVLVVSFLGYSTKAVPVNGRAQIDIELDVDAEVLDDVVVVAYGTARKEATTGSVATVTGDVFSESPVVSVDNMLGGKIAGVSVSNSSGQPERVLRYASEVSRP